VVVSSSRQVLLLRSSWKVAAPRWGTRAARSISSGAAASAPSQQH